MIKETQINLKEGERIVVGQMVVFTNSSGEIFINHGKTTIRLSDMPNEKIMAVIHGGNVSFMPGSANGSPCITFG